MRGLGDTRAYPSVVRVRRRPRGSPEVQLNDRAVGRQPTPANCETGRLAPTAPHRTEDRRRLTEPVSKEQSS